MCVSAQRTAVQLRPHQQTERSPGGAEREAVQVTTRRGRLLQRLVGRLALWFRSRSFLEPLHIEEILFAPGRSLVGQEVLAGKHGGLLVCKTCRNALSPGIR